MGIDDASVRSVGGALTYPGAFLDSAFEPPAKVTSQVVGVRTCLEMLIQKRRVTVFCLLENWGNIERSQSQGASSSRRQRRKKKNIFRGVNDRLRKELARRQMADC